MRNILVLSALAIAALGCSAPATRSAKQPNRGTDLMQTYYLEIVTPDVDAVCGAYAAAYGVQFGDPEPALGNARTAPLSGGGFVGVRAPLRASEQPVVRPYWLVPDIDAAVAAAVKAGARLALPPMDIPGYGKCAIYILGGVEHGIWQR
jgi:predicted enzyme related to lactoylglutathione lyase